MPPMTHAALASLAAALLALPVALGLWAARPALQILIGAAVAALAALGWAAGTAPILADAALGLPLAVLPTWARLSRLAPSALRIATVSGLGPMGRFRFLVLPLLLPGAGVGFLLVLAGLMTNRILLPGAVVAALIILTLKGRK